MVYQTSNEGSGRSRETALERAQAAAMKRAAKVRPERPDVGERLRLRTKEPAQ